MSKYDGLDGRAITLKVREDIARSGVTMNLAAGSDQDAQSPISRRIELVAPDRQ